MITKAMLNDVKAVKCKQITMKSGDISFMLEPSNSLIENSDLINVICYVYTMAKARNITNRIFFKLNIDQFKEMFPTLKTISFQYFKHSRKFGVFLDLHENDHLCSNSINETSLSAKALYMFKSEVILESRLDELLPEILSIPHSYFVLNVDSKPANNPNITELIKSEKLIFTSATRSADEFSVNFEGVITN